MARQHEQTVGAVPGATDDGGRLVTFGVLGVFDEVPVLELDRWTGVLQRNTSAAAAAICLFDGPCRVVKSVCAAAGASHQVELAPTTSLEDHVLGLARGVGQTDGGSYAEVPVTLDGLVVGQICIARGPHESIGAVELLASAPRARARCGCP